mmetsp:Transcript_36881/g.75187  ORF Transcript_36881/g.75187 Transcript_36881/m.75187 type:complete len:390 (+) Transcript_36881:60-1229(+)
MRPHHHLLLLTTPLLAHSAVYQLQHHIPRRNTQCIYSDFKAGQTATFELFILDSPTDGRLSAGVQIEGPIASDKIGEPVLSPDGEETGERTSQRVQPEDTWDPNRYANKDLMTMGALLQDAIGNWPRFLTKQGSDFQSRGIIHHFFHIDYTHSGEDEDAMRARAEITRQIQREEQDRRRRLIEERHNMDRRREVEEEVYEQENAGRMPRVLPDHIAPYEWTKRIKSSGWYRLCVQADDDILVEMDIRNSAVFGGVNQETGHVWTFDDWEEWEEEQRINKLDELKEQAKKDEEARAVLEQLNKALSDQVKDYDLESTQRLMTEVNNLVSQMQQKQSSVHQRIKSHEGISKRNYQRIKKSGIVETLLYLLITGYQVYTVHNWLLSTNSLGR